MKKEFNDTGSCNPDIHYMVDTGEKIEQIVKLIEKGKYFTINRPRQYGKSTCLESIEKRLSTSDYFVLFTTFESMSEVDFLNEKNFIREFLRQLNKIFKRNNYQQLVDFTGRHHDIETFEQLDDFITGMVELIGKPTVLQIDEVDKSSDNQLFLNFLGLLRSKYLSRHKYSTFHSVILASVYDIKTLKLKIRPDEERKYNSPWNIAADFRVDLTFNPKEIATMLTD
ncbi:MAG: AAA family ATPase, partial [Candidatus Aminicenantes bacterium]|nr:AAA family ATPase [Candidatus Aminicenantes bacterium]NIM78911.1 AAA family ATPase [Candidatus Aminicenantes bacterium]NIN18171.1 AAA family ATPase [Candidatus Aminicenantes bacterium]NIN42070.1 AAA family ATPase [Candidatus Aminicenantes bacterium]NIN84823.1 AAA family ATPase [Candidatus Aminicenantes bacterium]